MIVSKGYWRDARQRKTKLVFEKNARALVTAKTLFMLLQSLTLIRSWDLLTA
jgi:hypothetical protein